MIQDHDLREFTPEELAAARAFIDGLPPEVQRVYVDEWSDKRWRFVFGDDRWHAADGLRRLGRGRRFRIRFAIWQKLH
jgi:hypothetical protein